MDTDDLPEPDDDFVESCVMRWGLPGFVIGLAAVTATLIYICRRAIEIFFPGVTL
ncbi:hypothetical protein LMG26858_06173 [Achromobacter anxifer]|uniref:Uncharacterized protein n=1 Tax=Achromobacter anxifer TaxID=1287737 RepID=A0A6S7EU79_9BURK|nr:hypothetical protein [Achromobacter anxifer]CAB3928205.1 hypothetical protein LMG26858_06173 [Achromobacter anxifer]